MSEAMVRAGDYTNVKREFESSRRLRISWRDPEGDHALWVEDGKAHDVGVALFHLRTEDDRTDYLKQIIAEERF